MTINDKISDDKADAFPATSLIDIARAAAQTGPAWSESTEDLNVNLVVLKPGHPIGEHINSDFDVLLVGIDGSGHVTIDGHQRNITPGCAVVVPKGTARSISPASLQFAYLTCHRRRKGLWPTVLDTDR